MPRVERISSRYATQDFASGNAELDSWLHNAAETADRAGTARVYLWIDDDHVVGYFAIAPHTVRRENLPSSIGRGAPDSIPAFLLARLALHEDLRGRGHGGELLAAALDTTLSAIRVGGGRVIVVDAIDANAHDFYAHYGFRPVPDNDDRLIMKASTAAANLHITWP